MADLAEPITPVSPLASRSSELAALAPAVLLAETPVAALTIRTDDPDVIARLQLPGACSISRAADGTTAVWLGPDEWLIYRADVIPHRWASDIATLGGTGAYVCDVSAQRSRLVLGGPHATTILAHGCAIDLDERSFGTDGVAQTLLAQAGVILHRADPAYDPHPGLVLFVRSSFADYLADWLIDAATEYLPIEDTSIEYTTRPEPKAPTS